MQLTSVNTAASSRPISASVGSAWRDRNQSESDIPQSPRSIAERKTVTAAARPIASREQLRSDGEAQAINSAPISPRQAEELIQQQQQTGVFAAEVRTAEAKNDESQDRRKEAITNRRAIPHYSLASYTGERANRAYLQHAGQRSGRMVDDMV